MAKPQESTTCHRNFYDHRASVEIRQPSPMYNVWCRAQIDKLFCSVLCCFSLSSFDVAPTFGLWRLGIFCKIDLGLSVGSHNAVLESKELRSIFSPLYVAFCWSDSYMSRVFVIVEANYELYFYEVQFFASLPDVYLTNVLLGTSSLYSAIHKGRSRREAHTLIYLYG
jgi:hypothetical protein